MPSESTPDSAAQEELLRVAVEHASTRVPLARPEQAVGEVRDGLAGGNFESADAVAVLAASALVGFVPVERLLAAPADARIADVMDADPPVVAPGEDQEVVAWKMVRHGETLTWRAPSTPAMPPKSRSVGGSGTGSRGC